MRITGGKLGGRAFQFPTGLSVRPTTDFARQALFNILVHRFSLEDAKCLDLFSGSGAISFELVSRGASAVCCVDANMKCIEAIKKNAVNFKLNVLTVVKSDAISFIRNHHSTYDFIFADPPYAYPGLPELPDLILQSALLRKDGLLVLEHGTGTVFHGHSGLIETRQYGEVHFSFFAPDKFGF
jgi:16S rRNA (guanine(966)-N(2))-methyltransferase RsmD